MFVPIMVLTTDVVIISVVLVPSVLVPNVMFETQILQTFFLLFVLHVCPAAMAQVVFVLAELLIFFQLCFVLFCVGSGSNCSLCKGSCNSFFASILGAHFEEHFTF